MNRLRQWITPTPGGALVLAASTGYAALWLLAKPAGQPRGRYLGETCGAEAVMLLSTALLLTTLLPAIERSFGGLDRVAVWHRNLALAAIALLVPHVLFVTTSPDRYETTLGHALGDMALLGLLLLSVWAMAPKMRAARWPGPVRRLARASYERWLSAHRLAGIFVMIALVHASIVAPALRASVVLRTAYIAVGVIGVAAYLYRELLARFVVPIHDYTVAQLERPTATTATVRLTPTGEPLRFVPGQFVVISFGGASAWQRHPFSVASAPTQPQLELSIKAAGDYTRALQEQLTPGTPARAVGPFGGFDYQRGGARQIWIAGGIGITPFISWLRAIEEPLDRTVDFYYSIASDTDGLYLDEIETVSADHPELRFHRHVTSRDGYITADATFSEAATPPGELWIYLCGPPGMVRALAKDYRRLGVPAANIRWERFDIR